MKKDNKGFSLVELIVVVAIMAVLMTVLAPQMLRYVERTRLQKDNSAISEIANAMSLAMTDEYLKSKIGTEATVTISNAAGSDATIDFKKIADADAAAKGSCTCKELAAELAAIMGESFTTESTTYNKAGTAITLKVTSDGKVSATGGFLESDSDEDGTFSFTK